MPKHKTKTKHLSDPRTIRTRTRPLRQDEICDLLDSSDDDLPEIVIEPEDTGGDERVQEEFISRELPVFIGDTVSFFNL
jgi:hypothetical protein